MSCANCGSCTAAGGDSSDGADVHGLLTACERLCAPGQVLAESEENLRLMNALGFAIAEGQARPLEALATVFHELGAQKFVGLAAVMLELGCRGQLVALAYYGACGGSSSKFHRLLVEGCAAAAGTADDSRLQELVRSVNVAAQQHEWVPGNVPIGRLRWPPPPVGAGRLVEARGGVRRGAATDRGRQQRPQPRPATGDHEGDSAAMSSTPHRTLWPWCAAIVVAGVACAYRMAPHSRAPWP
jgi:hypothetical protein